MPGKPDNTLPTPPERPTRPDIGLPGAPDVGRPGRPDFEPAHPEHPIVTDPDEEPGESDDEPVEH
jgi:hypothetical protein